MALIDLAAARDACNLQDGDTGKDAWLTSAIDAASAVIEDIVGAVSQASRTATLSGGGVAVVLPFTPTDVTSVTADGEVWASYCVSGAVVYAGSGSFVRRTTFPPGAGNVVVEYEVGSDDVPPAIAMATSELVRHWFQFGQQGQRPGFGGETIPEQAWPGSGSAVPKRVMELLEPYASGRRTGLA